ncbi:MAG: MFS transporter [Spirochaetales bacterium]
MSENESSVRDDDEDIGKDWKLRFFTIFAGQALSLFGSSLVQFALVWYLAKQTGSATLLATATLVAMLPQILLGPFAGALVDRWNRRSVMIVADACIALATLVLVILFRMGAVRVWHIYASSWGCGPAAGPSMARLCRLPRLSWFPRLSCRACRA